MLHPFVTSISVGFPHSAVNSYIIFVCLKMDLERCFDLVESKLYWVGHLSE